MRFVWFWSFWHWSTESFRDGSLLRRPLHGIGSHWDEWFRHEASDSELKAIEDTGRTRSTQRQFIAWLLRHWAREMDWNENRMVPRYVLGQLAHLPPFDRWPAFEPYRTGYGVAGVSAVVLAAESHGEAEDVRRVEALALPAEAAPAIRPEGFHADAAELETARRAARSLLCGKALLVFLTLWMAGGHRPYPRWLRIVLGLGWLAVGGSILHLLLGPEPGEQLFLWSAMLMALWSSLLLIGGGGAAWLGLRAWRQGLAWATRLEQSEVRMRMNGGLTLKGESAGLPFCLNTVLALSGAEPVGGCRSWIWHRFIAQMRAEATHWAATGVITADGHLKPVVLGLKLRACLQHDGIRHLLTPRQHDGRRRAVQRVADAISTTDRPEVPAPASAGIPRLGFAAEKSDLQTHRCRHVAQSMMALGGFADRWQLVTNGFALGVSLILLGALPDLRSILIPHPAPVAVIPASASPYFVWVSLDTRYPEYFSAVLESDYWSNRRSDIKQRGGATPSVRAELHLHRLTGMTETNEEAGVVWIERRHRFLSREFRPGERVGRYSIPYLSRLGHE